MALCDIPRCVAMGFSYNTQCGFCHLPPRSLPLTRHWGVTSQRPLSKLNVFPLIPHFQAYRAIPLLLLLPLDLPLILFLKQDAVTVTELWSLQRQSGPICFISAPRLPLSDKCVAADLGYLGMVNRIHLPALGWAIGHM